MLWVENDLLVLKMTALNSGEPADSAFIKVMEFMGPLKDFEKTTRGMCVTRKTGDEAPGA